MNHSRQNTEFWSFPELDVELFRARGIHYSYARHSHSYYSIGVIEAGVGGNYYRGSTYLAPPKSIVLMNPEEVHTGYSAEDLPLTYRMLYLNPALMQQVAGMQGERMPFFKDAVIQDEVLVKHLFQLHNAIEKSQQLEKQTLLIEVLSGILKHYAETKTTFQPRQEHRSVSLVKEYLHEHFSSSISLEQLVELTNLNRSYLIRVFRRAVGMPPYNYLNQVRVEKAKQFLSQGMSVADTAFAVGMSDQSHLTRHFRRIVGVTPGHYRSRQRSSS